ncbi:MAG: DNA polymerase IV [Candidatus Omnitrophota bacterium]
MPKRRFIVHLDMDAFFAAIEERDNPDLRGKPVVIGADPKAGRGRGVVSTCSYAARKFGIHSAMPISIAYRKCPGAVFLKPDMEKYSAVSNRIMEILYTFTHAVEPVSVDEAFLDISDTYVHFGTPLQTCLLIKSRIKEAEGLTASVGLAPNKLAAKIASEIKKPDGMVEVTPENLLAFLRPLSIKKIWGLGEKSRLALEERGIKTIGELAGRDIREIIALFGKTGAYFWQLANGIDEREVEPETEAKSISNEFTFDEDTSAVPEIKAALLSLCEEVSSRLRQAGHKSRTVTVKIRFGDFKTFTRAVTIKEPTNSADTVYRKIKLLADGFLTGRKKVRLVGVKVSGLIPSDIQGVLFKSEGENRSEKLYQAIDEIREKFGYDSIYRSSTRSIRK